MGKRGWTREPGEALATHARSFCALSDFISIRANSMANDKPLGRKMAKAAAIGAVIGIPVPFVGPVFGALAGAGYAYFKSKKQG